ncbi:hypothetical protein OESDEN_05448 [Oesophagostomum dentatum]|uniref:Uncharacterized protein n=1 Tax=Oesophagostomum dentatum TaxID=61180 RepID=A0A0B1TBH7_OESDE|nr:hypothetical protein OESDEN_05448 [Oesophagostomum dentatum]
MDKICEEGLRFHPLEQVVYHLSNSGTSKKSYPYYSSLVEIIHSSDSEGNETFKFRVGFFYIKGH